jgi:hypothetical protein
MDDHAAVMGRFHHEQSEITGDGWFYIGRFDAVNYG